MELNESDARADSGDWTTEQMLTARFRGGELLGWLDTLYGIRGINAKERTAELDRLLPD